MKDLAPEASPKRTPGGNIAAHATSVFLPKEHGSWSLALEPVLLGALVAPTAAAGALSAAALAGFFARRPLRSSIEADASGRRRTARAMLAFFCVIAAAGLLEAVALAGLTALWPLLITGASGGLFFLFDLRRDSRSAAAEISGFAAFGFLPAAFALAAGWPIPAALALSATILARSVPTVLTLRGYLNRAKGRSACAPAPLLAALVSLLLIMVLALNRLVPWCAPALAGILLVRSVFLLGALHPTWAARRVGFIESWIGLAYVVATALAYRL